MKKTLNLISKQCKLSFFKALFASLIFVVIYFFSNIEIIRENMEDYSFDIVNNVFFTIKPQETSSPKVKIFAVDEKYLKSENLLNENNETNYGYTFPRDKIAQFINKLDTHINLVKENTPKALFIDYDMTYKTTNYDKVLSQEDKELIEVLKKHRQYIIIFPKTSNLNFIQNSDDLAIRKLIKENKIIFASVGLSVSSDGINRRYFPYKKFEDIDYLNAPITLYNLLQDKQLAIDELKQQNVIENRIIYKDYYEATLNEKYNLQQSYWNNLNKYSANYPLDLIMNEDFKDSIIVFGNSYKKHDSFTTYTIAGTNQLYGVDIQANALMTLFWFKGSLQKLNLFIGLLLILSIFFILDLAIEIIFEFFKWQEHRVIEFTVLLIISTLTMVLISNHILSNYQLWFNWVVPLIVFQIIELIEMLKLKDILIKIRSRK